MVRVSAAGGDDNLLAFAGDLAAFVAGQVGAEAVAAEQADIDRAAPCARPFHVFQEIDQVGGLQLRFGRDFAKGGRHGQRDAGRQHGVADESMEWGARHVGLRTSSARSTSRMAAWPC